MRSYFFLSLHSFLSCCFCDYVVANEPSVPKGNGKVSKYTPPDIIKNVQRSGFHGRGRPPPLTKRTIDLGVKISMNQNNDNRIEWQNDKNN